MINLPGSLQIQFVDMATGAPLTLLEVWFNLVVYQLLFIAAVYVYKFLK